jgi:hypothetical protein
MRTPSLGALLLAAAGCLALPATAGASVVGGFTQAPTAPVMNEVVTFTSTSSAPGKGNRLIAQQWDLDNDGAFDDASGQTATRAFAPAGMYIVRLRSVDRYLNEAIVAQAVSVSNPPATPLLSPFPVVQMGGRVTRKGTRVRVIVRAPIGATITVKCRGRGCPLRRQTRLAKANPKSAGAPTRVIRLRRLERRRLHKGARITVMVRRAGSIGKYSLFKVRRGRPPKRTDSCIAPGAAKPTTCPAG